MFDSLIDTYDEMDAYLLGALLITWLGEYVDELQFFPLYMYIYIISSLLLAIIFILDPFRSSGRVPDDKQRRVCSTGASVCCKCTSQISSTLFYFMSMYDYILCEWFREIMWVYAACHTFDRPSIKDIVLTLLALGKGHTLVVGFWELSAHVEITPICFMVVENINWCCGICLDGTKLSKNTPD